MIRNFESWLQDQQNRGRYKTKLRLDGWIRSQTTNEMRYLNGDYYVYMEHGNEIYNCINENDIGATARRRDILKILQEVYYTEEPEKWIKKSSLYLDGKNENQSADTFNGTLIYVVVMLLLTVFNQRIIGWIGATIVYFIWKSSKYN